MSEKERKDREPRVEQGESVSSGTKSRSALTNIRREMSDEELSSPGALKLLVDRLDRAESQVTRLAEFQEKYYESDKEVAVLKERVKKKNSYEVLYSASLALGAVFIGLAPSAWKTQPYGVLSLVTGVCLIILAVISKVVRK